MASPYRGQTPDIKKLLLEDGPHFSFIQALRILRLIACKENGADGDESELNRRISIRPELSLSFPESDISSIKQTAEDPPHFNIEATFLELYGPSSPLPTFYTENLLAELSEDKSITRDFLDIINAPLYTVYFKIWNKYRLFYRIVEQLDHDTLQRLYCLLGLENDTLQKQVDDSYSLLRYIGLTTQFPRSAEGLRTMISDNLDEPSIRIIQCISRIAVIPEDQRFILGVSGNTLGENSYLGEEIEDRMGKFRIQASPADSESFHRFLPDRQAFGKINDLVHFYLDQPLLWDMELIIDSENIQPARLGGDRWSQLGWNTWTYSEKVHRGTVSVTLSTPE